MPTLQGGSTDHFANGQLNIIEQQDTDTTLSEANSSDGDHPSIDKRRVGVFILLTAGIFASFLVNGIAHEAIFRFPGFKDFGWFLTFVQFVVYVGFSRFHLSLIDYSGASWSLQLVALAIFNVVTMGLSNASVGYMNYPTQLMFKSCKVISVMIAGIVIQRSHHGVRGGFNRWHSRSQPRRSDPKTWNRTHGIFKTYSIGAVLLFGYLCATGEGTKASEFCLQTWHSTIPLMAGFAFTGYVGVLLILKMIEIFGALPAVIVTTTRKAVTIALSFLLFDKPFSIQYVWSGLLILLGIYFNAQKDHFQRLLSVVNAASWF